MRQPARCKGCVIGLLSGLLWALFSYGLTGAIDWTGAIIFAFVLTIISVLIAHWRLCQIH